MLQDDFTPCSAELPKPFEDPDPHTPAWFDCLRELNHQQAVFTEQIVTLAGRLDVCTVCGDPDSTEFRLSDAPCLRMRLCRDCQVIQRTILGLKLSTF